jgi:hypothetical protein
MPLKAGDITATTEMSKAIYDQLDHNLLTDDEKKKLKPAELESIQNGWRKLAYAIAQGVVNYLEANLEIVGVQTKGNVNASVSGNTLAGGPDNHVHGVSLTATQNNVVFTQSNDGTGRIK